MIKYDQPSGEFIAHGTTVIHFTFRPTESGDFKTTLKLSIDNGGAGDARFVEERRVMIRGSCSDVPIAVEHKEYNLKTCLFDHTFRENIVLINRGNRAMKVTVDRPKLIEGQLQITPNLAFVQGLSEQALQVKFCPKDDFLIKHPEYIDKERPGEQGAFKIPIRVMGADQVEPVLSQLVGTLTTDGIKFTPMWLDFGRCFVGSAVVGRITVVNESLLPQQVAFMRLPPYLSIADVPLDSIAEEAIDSSDAGTSALEGGGTAQFSTLLPNEKREICVTYTPDAATELKYGISTKTICGSLCVRDYTLKCKGQGVNPILQLSHSQVDMTAIPVDASTKESVVLTNVSKTPQIMNLLVPDEDISCMHVTPVCCIMQPGEQRRIQVEFKPTQRYVDVLKILDEHREPPEPPADGEEAKDDPCEVDEEDVLANHDRDKRYRMLKLRRIRGSGGRRWEVKAKKKSSKPDDDSDNDDDEDDNAAGRSAGGSGAADGDAAAAEEGCKTWVCHDDPVGTVHTSWKLAITMRPWSGEMGPKQNNAEERKNATIYLAVRTCVLPTLLTAEPATLDFGEVTAGQRQILPITLFNAVAEEPQELHMESLPENACFTVLNAPRSIGAGPFKLVVEFKPERVQIYQSSLKLYTQNTRMQVPLCGRGVRPVLCIEPEDGIVNLGSVCYSKESKDYVQAKVEIKNSSPFELIYNLETVIPADPCHVGPSPFTLTPSTGVVEGNGQKTVTVTFRPHRPLEVFKEKILVNVPNQKEPTYLYLYGHCFQYQAFLIPPMVFGPFARAEAKSQDAFLDTLAVGSGSTASPDTDFTYQKAQRREISLLFERGDTSQFILFGNGVMPGTPWAPQNAAAVNYDIQIVQSQFSGLFTVEMEVAGGKPDKLAKGPLLPGAKAIKAIFKYNPPEDTSLACGDVGLDMLAGIGQWVTCKVKCILSGGYVPPSETPTQEINVELRAYLTQLFMKS